MNPGFHTTISRCIERPRSVQMRLIGHQANNRDLNDAEMGQLYSDVCDVADQLQVVCGQNPHPVPVFDCLDGALDAEEKSKDELTVCELPSGVRKKTP